MFYQKVVDYCQKNNMSIHAFESMCGIGNGTIARWESKGSKPALETLDKIAKATKIPIKKWIE